MTGSIEINIFGRVVCHYIEEVYYQTIPNLKCYPDEAIDFYMFWYHANCHEYLYRWMNTMVPCQN